MIGAIAICFLLFLAPLARTQREAPSTPTPSPTGRTWDPTSLSDTLTDYLLDHDLQKALRRLESIVRTDPDSATPRLILARLADCAGDSMIALAQLDAIESGDFEPDAKRAARELRAELQNPAQASSGDADRAEEVVTPAPESDGRGNRAYDLLRIARILRTDGTRLLAESSPIPTELLALEANFDHQDSLAEFERWMSDGIRHLESEAWERAINAFLSAQACSPDSIEPTVRLFVVAGRMRSADHALPLSRLARGRMTPVLARLVEYPDSVWWIENQDAYSALAAQSDPESLPMLEKARRIVTLHRLIQAVGSIDVKGTYLVRLADAIETPELRSFERHLRSKS